MMISNSNYSYRLDKSIPRKSCIDVSCCMCKKICRRGELNKGILEDGALQISLKANIPTVLKRLTLIVASEL